MEGWAEDYGASADADRAGRASHGAEVCPSSPPSGDHPLRGLIARLEAASGPDFDLEAAISEAIGRDDTLGSCPSYTASIDAALTLLPEGSVWELGLGRYHSWAVVEAVYGGEAEAPTPALALCIAALYARDRDRDPEGDETPQAAQSSEAR